MRSLKIILIPSIFSIPVLVVSAALALSQTVGVWSPFTVNAYVPPNSHISRLTHDGDGIYTLRVVGTVGVEYYLEATTSLEPPVVWASVPGSTHLVTESHEQWEVVVTVEDPDFCFFRSAEVTP
jgi:hypothetical protein